MEKNSVFTGKNFTGRVHVLEVITDSNKLKVSLTKPFDDNDLAKGFSVWEENWNLQHVGWGFESGEYFTKDFPEFPPINLVE